MHNNARGHAIDGDDHILERRLYQSLDLIRQRATGERIYGEFEQRRATVLDDVRGPCLGIVTALDGGVRVLFDFPRGISAHPFPMRPVEFIGFESIVKGNLVVNVASRRVRVRLSRSRVGIDTGIRLGGSTLVEGVLLVAILLAAVAHVPPTFSGIVSTLGIASPIPNPLPILHMALSLLYDLVPRINAEEPKRTQILAVVPLRVTLLHIAPVRAVVIAGVETTVSQIERAGLRVVRSPGIAGAVAEVAGFLDAAAGEAFYRLKAVGATLGNWDGVLGDWWLCGRGGSRRFLGGCGRG
mmetsp:Transcript_19710/g.35826  ORF Transcript_19710/g.35826 Transcript_19710/m.35826 type:complete len:298 (+) Transcript_19710:214-1107(+)